MPSPSRPAGPIRLALRGDLLDFAGRPAWGDVEATGALRFRPGHWLLADDGRIVDVVPDAPGDDWEKVDHAGRLVLPGFVDAHVHSPQVDVVASYGTALLDWLETHTFPAEARHADAAHAGVAAEHFLDALASHGTTAAIVFPTVHETSTDALFEGARRRGMRLVAGKVLMDRNAPDDLRDPADVAEVERTLRASIDRWHGRDRLAYALTVRFAATSTPAQLAMAGRLATEDPSLYVHTHLAENEAEVRWIAELFPEARSYADVYARAGLVRPRSVYAHGIWLDDADRRALAEGGATIAHAPSSNLFLGSGLFDWRGAARAGIGVAMASDVGGGTSLCQLRTMADAYKVQALRGERLTAWVALHAATRGAAEALDLGAEIGSFEPGRAADLAVWDWWAGSVAERRHGVARTLHERVFAWMTLADDRNAVETRVAGRVLHRRAAP